MLGDRIREFRKRAGLTQQKMADALGVSDTLCNHWETGKRKPTLDMLRQIAELTFGDFDILVHADDPPPLPNWLSDEERRLLDTWRRLNERQRRNLQRLLDASADVRRVIEDKR